MQALAGNPDALIAELDALFFNHAISPTLQARLKTMLQGLRNRSARERVVATLILVSLSPEFVIQK